jgi:phosphotransferase system HPr (HPr) family protein
MQKADLSIQNTNGLHARPATKFVELAQQFECDVVLIKGEKEANAKSILSLMTLGIKANETVTIQADGSDEESAIQALLDLVARNFDESV